MVGDTGSPGSAAAGLSASVGAAYDQAAPGWDNGPGRLYADLATALMVQPDVPVPGSRVLDLGAGTGIAGTAALAAGAARVVAADIAPGMLRYCPPALRPVAADATALPFADRSFDLAVAAFCLGHLPDIPACLAEVRRVCGSVAASAFAPGWAHPAKQAVDEVLADAGFRPPDWYQTFKRQTEPRGADAAGMLRQLAAAGFTGARARTVLVRTQVSAPPELASWRLGMAHVAPWVASLSAARQAALRQAARTAAARAGGGPLRVSMLVLTAS